jgi:TonB family protein
MRRLPAKVRSLLEAVSDLVRRSSVERESLLELDAALDRLPQLDAPDDLVEDLLVQVDGSGLVGLGRVPERSQVRIVALLAALAGAIILLCLAWQHNGAVGSSRQPAERIFTVKQVRFRAPPDERELELSPPKIQMVPIPDPTVDEPEPFNIWQQLPQEPSSGPADQSRLTLDIPQPPVQRAAGSDANRDSPVVTTRKAYLSELAMQNALAGWEHNKFYSKLHALKLKAEELERIGENADADELRRQLGDLQQKLSPDASPAFRTGGADPEPTEAARRAFFRGTVVLGVDIDIQGRVAGFELLRGLPYGLTEAAVDAVRSWTFEPATSKGVAVRSRLTVPVDFSFDPIDSDGSLARAFFLERSAIDNLVFQEPRGYWANTYIPGDPELRRLQVSLSTPDRDLRSFGKKQLHLHELAGQSPQPFDPPQRAAMALYLSSDRRGLAGRERLLMEVGLKGADLRSGMRPIMNLALVLDLRGLVPEVTAELMLSLVQTLAAAHDLGDRFSLIIAGREGGLLVPHGSFRHGQLLVAMKEALAADPGSGLDLVAAVKLAAVTVAQEDDPSSPLGASIVLLATGQPLAHTTGELESIAHRSAVAGIPVSVIGIGSKVDLSELDRLVLAGQGHRRLLNQADEAVGLVQRELTAVSQVVARAARLSIRLAPGIQLVEVIGSHRLDAGSADWVREAEDAIDRRLARNLGIVADRGLDDEGIQIVIPSFLAGDEHVILLDLVAPGPGPVADVTLRYKDLVWLRNGSCSAHLSLSRDPGPPSPLQRNVLSNLLAMRLGSTLERSSRLLAQGSHEQAVGELKAFHVLLIQLPLVAAELGGDNELKKDAKMLQEYISLLEKAAGHGPDLRQHLADSLSYAGRLRVLSRRPDSDLI